MSRVGLIHACFTAPGSRRSASSRATQHVLLESFGPVSFLCRSGVVDVHEDTISYHEDLKNPNAEPRSLGNYSIYRWQCASADATLKIVDAST